ncbi:MAG: helix-turn-helix domain-containing protein [Kofleriaceae bacterium]
MEIEVREFANDAPRVAIPSPHAQIAVRFGPMTRTGMDVSALGSRETVHRKLIRAGMRIVVARLPIAVAERVLGAPAGAIAGTIVPLEDLWGAPAVELGTQLANAPDVATAAAILNRAIELRISTGSVRDARTTLAVAAAEQLAHASVREVAFALGISERQLRRIFHDVVGLSPKTFAKLTRFRRAVDAAKAGASWTRVAAATGYCDQAHLIDEFHAITGATPRAFMTELSAT